MEELEWDSQLDQFPIQASACIRAEELEQVLSFYLSVCACACACCVEDTSRIRDGISNLIFASSILLLTIDALFSPFFEIKK